MSIERRVFGTLADGREVDEYLLTNAAGSWASIITYGGILRELWMPDGAGAPGDVVLGFRTLEEYLRDETFVGATIGPVAGRITRGRFTLEGREFRLEINNGPNHAHGGSEGFHRQLWSAEPVVGGGDGAALRLTYDRPAGRGGYPGNLSLAVTYSLSDENQLSIDYFAETDEPTPLSMTNHSYFNLSGEGSGPILDHHLQIPAQRYVPTDDEMTLLDGVESVEGKANDFRQSRRIGDAVPEIFKSHGDNYLLGDAKSEELRPAARVVDPASGRVMEAETTEQCVQFYTGLYLDGSASGKSGRPYRKHGAFCLECQGYPNGANAPEVGDIILRPGNSYRQRTVYRFSTV